MKCCECRRAIAAGAEGRKMIVEYRTGDTTTLYGYQMPAGPVTAAVGTLSRAWHHKCFHTRRRRDARGGTGRLLDAAPTGYDMAAAVLTRDEAAALGLSAEQAAGRTGHLSDRLAVLREVAAAVGKPIGDPEVTEAFHARDRGGPYPHTHGLGLSTYQLRAHLYHAHGVTERTGDIHSQHAQLHTVPDDGSDGVKVQVAATVNTP